MADLTSRPDSWMDYLPGNWQQAINTNPLLNALGRATSRPTPDLTRGIEYDQHGSVSDRNWLLEQARGGPPKMNPLAAEMLDKGGLMANFLGPGVKLPPVAPKPTGIRAYHGSPHDFDKFDMSKIGTGEGAQAYGRGLYFAESEGVAKSYRDDLSGANPYRIAGRDYAKLSPDARRYAEFVAKGGDLGPERERVLASLEEARRLVRPGASDPYGIARREIADAEALLAAIDEIGVGTPVTPATGRMYEVNIKADPDQFLDWDLPLAQQPEGVRRAVEGLPQADVLTRKNGVSAITPLMDREGDAFYNALAERLGTPFDPKFPSRPERLDHAKATQALREAGIPGIKYLDQQSRAAGQGSRNYVVWDDKLIEILRKYGLLPPVAAGTAAALNQQEPQQ